MKVNGMENGRVNNFDKLTTDEIAFLLGVTKTEAYGFVQVLMASGLACESGRRRKAGEIKEKVVKDALGIEHKIAVQAGVKGKGTYEYTFTNPGLLPEVLRSKLDRAIQSREVNGDTVVSFLTEAELSQAA